MGNMNSKLAIFLTGICNQTYYQFKDDHRSFMVPKGYKLCSTFTGNAFGQQKEAFGFILESDQELIVAFRGSASHMDAISDLEAHQIDCPWGMQAGKTHYGFTAIYQTIRDQILPVLQRCPSHKRLILTGHSLGGALATLCALDLAINTKFKPATVYTYGAPRVGDPKFAALFNSILLDSHRIMIASDVVPLVPPPIYKTPLSEKVYYYHHVREEFTLLFFSASISESHALANYYVQLAKYNPLYAEKLNVLNPQFCPSK